MKGKILEFRKRAPDHEVNQALADYALKALELERAVGAGTLKKHDRLIAEATLRRKLLSIAEMYGL